jgi:ubiquinone/menaquinone biosynthesis C-methylase UbiE
MTNIQQYIMNKTSNQESRMAVASSRTYLPAAGRDWLLPLYDPIVKLLGGDTARKALVDQAALHSDQRVLEVGCGTGSLVMQIKKLYPHLEVIGLDPDPKALARAKRKVARGATSIQFDTGFAGELPYPGAEFDRVFSSFMFHHLPADEKKKMLSEVRRVLKSDGELHLLDFEGPGDGKHGFLSHLLHSNERLKDNSERAVLNLMRRAGFANAQKMGRRTMLVGGAA